MAIGSHTKKPAAVISDKLRVIEIDRNDLLNHQRATFTVDVRPSA